MLPKPRSISVASIATAGCWRDVFGNGDIHLIASSGQSAGGTAEGSAVRRSPGDQAPGPGSTTFGSSPGRGGSIDRGIKGVKSASIAPAGAEREVFPPSGDLLAGAHFGSGYPLSSFQLYFPGRRTSQPAGNGGFLSLLLLGRFLMPHESARSWRRFCANFAHRNWISPKQHKERTTTDG